MRDLKQDDGRLRGLGEHVEMEGSVGREGKHYLAGVVHLDASAVLAQSDEGGRRTVEGHDQLAALGTRHLS